VSALPVEVATGLSELAAVANREHQLAKQELLSAVGHAARCGEVLNAAKEQVGHGGWAKWLKENFVASERTAQRYMLIAANPTCVSDLEERSINAALAAIHEEKRVVEINQRAADPNTKYEPVEVAGFVRQDDQSVKLVIRCDNEEYARDALDRLELTAPHKSTRGTLSFRYPPQPRRSLSSRRFEATKPLVLPRYPVFVPSKGRYQEERALTVRWLIHDGIPFRLVCEWAELEAYGRLVGDERCVVLPESGRGVTYSRNFIRDLAESEGHTQHWQLDDNMGPPRRLHDGERIPCAGGPALAFVEDFADRYENVAVAGLAYQMFVPDDSPAYRWNVHVYSASLINHGFLGRWRLLYNEDVDLCLQALDTGCWTTLLVNAFMVDKKTTMTVAGGNTDSGGPISYQGDGRRRMAHSLAEMWPDDAEVGIRYGREQHVVNWNKFTHLPMQKIDADRGPLEVRGLRLVQLASTEADT
jgi:TET-Associated Glycosyltransferase/Protein of unknown function (DUF3102)